MDGPWDPYEWILKPIVGDWAAILAMADVYTHISRALADMADNLGKAAANVPLAWTGNAGDGCRTYLSSLAAALRAAEAPLAEVHGQYTTAATAAHEFGKVITGIVDSLVEAAIAFVVAVGGATATVETILGAVVCGGIAAWEAHKFVEAAELVAKAYDITDTIMTGFSTAAETFGQINASHFAMPELPLADAASPMPHLEGR